MQLLWMPLKAAGRKEIPYLPKSPTRLHRRVGITEEHTLQHQMNDQQIHMKEIAGPYPSFELEVRRDGKPPADCIARGYIGSLTISWRLLYEKAQPRLL